MESKKGAARGSTKRVKPVAAGNNNTVLSEEQQWKKYERSVMREKPVKQAKATRRVAELKQTRHVSVNERAMAEDGGMQLGTTREAFESKKRARTNERLAPSDGAENKQHSLVTDLLPTRATQTRNNLEMANSHDEASTSSESAADGELYKQLISVNAHLYRERNESVFPLEGVISLGLFSAQAMSPDEKQERAASQLAGDFDFMRAQLQQLARLPPLTSGQPQRPNTMILSREQDGQSTTKRRRPNEPGDVKPATVKLTTTFGSFNFAFSYEKRASNEHKKFTFAEFDRRQAEMRRLFFLNDPLDDETPFGSPPYRFKLFRQLQAENMERFKAKDRVPLDASSTHPKSDLETVCRAHITTFRRRPRDGQQLCFNGTRCLCFLFRTDPALRYIARAFFTERQLEEMRDEDPSLSCETTQRRHPSAVCIDCLLHRWTLNCIDNIANEVYQTVPINHFTVKVGEGEYSDACMLPVRFNRLETGIVGRVPWYDFKQRLMKAAPAGVALTDAEENESLASLADGPRFAGGSGPTEWARFAGSSEAVRSTTSTAYLVDAESYVMEIGMDF
jgi:hypothetical protein